MIPECDRQVLAKGWCRAHYMRYRKHGSPTAGRASKVRKRAGNGEPQSWLQAHLDHGGDACLEWPYAKDINGYGVVYRDGVPQSAASIILSILHGPPKKGEVARFRCGNRKCVNPRHIVWSTRKWMPQDDDSAPFHAKVTCAEVREIRQKLAEGVRQQDIADRYGISRTEVSQINTRRSWDWLD